MKSVVSNSRIRTGVVLLILVSVFVGVGRAAAAPLGQAGTGTITGQVLSLDDVLLPNVRFAAFSEGPSTPNRVPLAEFQSDAQGRYSVEVPAGTVWIEVLTQDIGGQSFWGYSNLPVDVAAGQTVSGQDFRIAIRVVSEPQPAPEPGPDVVPVEPVGMPRTGAGAGLGVMLIAGLGMLLFGVAVRRRATS